MMGIVVKPDLTRQQHEGAVPLCYSTQEDE